MLTASRFGDGIEPSETEAATSVVLDEDVLPPAPMAVRHEKSHVVLNIEGDRSTTCVFHVLRRRSVPDRGQTNRTKLDKQGKHDKGSPLIYSHCSPYAESSLFLLVP